MKELKHLPLLFKDDGNKETPFGVYLIPHPKIKTDWFFVNVGEDAGWRFVTIEVMETISKSQRKSKKRERFPTPIEVSLIKEQFFGIGEIVVQYHPDHAAAGYMLTLYESTDATLSVPPQVSIGLATYLQAVEDFKKQKEEAKKKAEKQERKDKAWDDLGTTLHEMSEPAK